MQQKATAIAVAFLMPGYALVRIRLAFEIVDLRWRVTVNNCWLDCGFIKFRERTTTVKSSYVCTAEMPQFTVDPIRPMLDVINKCVCFAFCRVSGRYAGRIKAAPIGMCSVQLLAGNGLLMHSELSCPTEQTNLRPEPEEEDAITDANIFRKTTAHFVTGGQLPIQHHLQTLLFSR
jgi:hypothetical protein